MSLSRKGYKTINHKDVQYRWLLRNRGGINEASIYAQAAIGGRELIAQLPRVINVDLITAAIDFALAHGWSPNEAGETMRCRSRRGVFEVLEVPVK
ncbi:hypothetical protein ACFQY0_09920 [Haloferula chungangensis]|uniref:Uncharacterized protein n=1 Tax=Haloferula chungangensis TaxID=1048331 RepID=A0ABW2L5A5_9BACT